MTVRSSNRSAFDDTTDRAGDVRRRHATRWIAGEIETRWHVERTGPFHRQEAVMNDIGHVGPSSGLGATGAAARIHEASAAYRANAQGEAAPAAPRWAEGRDRVELSDHARHLDAIRAMPDVRMARVEAIKQAIASGTYESPEKLQAAIEGLLRDISE